MKQSDSTGKFSIKLKIILGVSFLVGMIISVTTITTFHTENRMLTASMDRSGKLLSNTLALACQGPMISQQYDEFVPYTEKIIAGDPDIQEVSIIDMEGTYLAYRTKDERVENKLGKKATQSVINTLDDIEQCASVPTTDGLYMDYIAGIKVGSSRFGSVIIRYSFDSLRRNKAETLERNIAMALLGLLAGIVISIILTKYITKGIYKLVASTKIIESGNLSHRVEVISNDEVKTLADSFNKMLDTLEAKNKALDRKVFEIETMFKASQAMNFQSDTDKLVKQILEMAGAAIHAERCSIMFQVPGVPDEIETKIVQNYQKGNTAIFPEKAIRIKSGEGVAGTVLKTGNSIIVNSGYKDPLFKSFDESSEYEKSIRNLISVPLKIKDAVTGVINGVNKTDGDSFTEDDKRLLEALAQQAAMAVEHARLYELAITDGLTKLFIHRYFQARLEEEITRAKRYHTTCSLIMFDIDHFKKFNDTYGHQQGDIVLMEVAKLIKQTIRETIDIPSRYGGEEFTIILPETDSNGAHLVAERLRKTVESYDFPGQSQALKVTISLGISTFPDHASEKAVLIKKADQALYACKGSGRNCSLVYNDSYADMGED